MFSKLTLLIFLCGLSYLNFAYAEPAGLSQDEGLKGKFTQLRYLEGFENPIRSSGDFYVVPKVGLVWQTLVPIESRMEIDQNGIRQSIRGGEISRIGLGQFPALSFLKSAMEESLSGNWDYLESLVGKKLIKSGDQWRLEYEPAASNPEMAFEKITFEIGDYLDRVEILKKHGDRDVITFHDQVRLPKSVVLEEFDQKPGTAQ